MFIFFFLAVWLIHFIVKTAKRVEAFREIIFDKPNPKIYSRHFRFSVQTFPVIPSVSIKMIYF